eukprot:CAMPEP_0113670062 /NCGR_PEP_ID=MMETSP0038_2-20120614/4926_1 /TAXON_ID=2898 /ORGANISM="Cryptomonas paramecium" /LENGTH=394 /DNA_ID=CAMNT_0000586033 /DNA_START=46 /DNA_END=1230 /DNA_ORIENTATION=- /assembly_acc=CAM_ASM_000170
MRTLLLVFALSAASAASLYEKDPDVELLNSLNFHTHIKKPDSMNHVKIIEFFTDSCANCKSFVKEYKELAKQLKGVIKVTAVNCGKEQKICNEYGVKTYPTLKVIPPGGFGTQEYSGERTAKAVYPWVMKFFSHFVEKVNSENVEAFLNKNAGKFKTILFTDKPKTPLLWRGLSVDFYGKMTLGEVKNTEKALCQRFKVSKFPTILVVKPGQKKPIKYDGKMDQKELFEFINRYQETFALENLAADEEIALKKPWLSENVPEMTSQSAADICYNGDAVCILAFVKPGSDGKLEKSAYDMIMAAKSKYASGNAKFAFMWVNFAKESSFSAALGVDSQPALVALRTGKRTRYAKSEGSFNSEGLSSFLDRVLGGDVQYKPLKDGPPALSPVEGAKK